LKEGEKEEKEEREEEGRGVILYRNMVRVLEE
jgi:hypothetical protein